MESNDHASEHVDGRPHLGPLVRGLGTLPGYGAQQLIAIEGAVDSHGSAGA